MADVIISRTFFCQKCAEAKRPNNDNLFLLYGRHKHKGFFYRYAGGSHPKSNQGFTPHIFINHGFLDNTAIMEVTRFCGCVDCDITVKPIGKGETLEFTVERCDHLQMTYEEWSALMKYKDPEYWVD